MRRPKYNRILVAAAWWLAGCYSFWPVPIGAAADFNYITNVTYHVNDDATTTVTSDYTVINNTPRMYVTELDLTTPTDSISNLHASYADGSAIPGSTSAKSTQLNGVTYHYQEITVNFPRVIYGLGTRWNFSVSYTASGLVDTKGSAHTIYVPSIERHDPGDQYSVTVDVPQSFGSPHFAAAEGDFSGQANGRQTYSFSQSQLSQQSLALVFGDSTVYDLNFNFPVSNPSPWPRTITVTLPPDLPGAQQSFVNRLSPAPADTRLDDDGNVLADYHLGPHQKINVTTDVQGRVNYLDYDLSRSLTKAQIPADLVQRYTKSTTYWSTDGAVAAAAAKLTNPKAPVIENVQRMYDYVIKTLSYNPAKIKFNIRQGAAQALAHPTNAVCLEYADLLIAMLRSQGIPARELVGYAYSGSLKDSPAVEDSLHAWVEAYVPGIGWVTLDPTWGAKFDEFGHNDMDHFAFAVWGENDSAPSAVMAGGTDEDYQYEQSKLTYQAAVAKASSGATVSLRRLAVLPFVAVDQVIATAQSQISTDNNQVSIGTQTVSLGSLAPGQTVTIRRLVLGADWDHAPRVILSRGQPAMLLAAANGQVDWRPLIIILGGLAVAGVVWLVLRLLEPKTSVEENLEP